MGQSADKKRTWTIGALIQWAREYLGRQGVDSPRLAGELLLAHALGLDRVQLYLRYQQPLTPAELAGFKELILRARRQEPIAYILGKKEFWGLELLVGPGVLIPRPETEHLVEEGLKRLQEVAEPRVLDLCTGSGAVALALAAERDELKAVAVDLSPQALDFARRNVAELGLEGRVELRRGHLFEPVAADGFFHLVTANPPYVSEAEWPKLPPAVREFEPRQALVAGPLGLELAEQIIAGAPAHLRAGGWLLMELGQGQAARARELAARSGAYEEIQIINDLAGIERVLACQRSDYG